MSHHEEIIKCLKESFGDDITESHIVEQNVGVVKEATVKVLHITMTRRVFHRAILLLKTKFGQPHISCPLPSKELEEGMELIYIFQLLSGRGDFKEIPVVIHVFAPYTDLRIRSITDIIPGAIFMEREAQEMLGVTIEDIPDSRRLFTPESMSEELKPHRLHYGEPEGLKEGPSEGGSI